MNELLNQFNLEVDAVNDALNFARGHVVLNDVDAALNSLMDAQTAMDRIEELLEENQS